MDDLNEGEAQRKLAQLRLEHQDLDTALRHLAVSPEFDQIQMQRMKKRKLALKDQILRVEALLHPDIIA